MGAYFSTRVENMDGAPGMGVGVACGLAGADIRRSISSCTPLARPAPLAPVSLIPANKCYYRLIVHLVQFNDWSHRVGTATTLSRPTFQDKP